MARLIRQPPMPLKIYLNRQFSHILQRLDEMRESKINHAKPNYFPHQARQLKPEIDNLLLLINQKCEKGEEIKITDDFLFLYTKAILVYGDMLARHSIAEQTPDLFIQHLETRFDGGAF